MSKVTEDYLDEMCAAASKAASATRDATILTPDSDPDGLTYQFAWKVYNATVDTIQAEHALAVKRLKKV